MKYTPVKVALLVLMAVTVSAQQNRITLHDAVEIALNNNPEMTRVQQKVYQKEYEDLAAWGNFMPKIDITASYTHLNDPIMIDLDPIRQAMITLQAKNMTEFANVYQLMKTGTQLTDQQRAALYQQNFGGLDKTLPLFVSQVKKQDYKTATITGIQPLFTGGKLLGAKSYASHELDAVLLEKSKSENEIRRDVVKSYLSIVMLQQVLKVRHEVLEGMHRHESRARRMMEEGLIANHQYLRAKVAVAEAEKNLANDTRQLALAYEALSAVLGVSDPVSIVDSIPVPENLQSAEMYLSSAKEYQPILALIKIKKEEAEDKITLERSKLMPTIALFGKYELYPEYLSMIEPRWAVGVQASLNLFNGLKDYAGLQSASYLKKEVEAMEMDAHSKIMLLVRKHYTDASNYQEQYIKSNEIVELSRENVRLNEKLFETGLGTSLELIDARLLLEKHLLEQVGAQHSFYQSKAELQFAAGIIQDFIKQWNTKQ